MFCQRHIKALVIAFATHMFCQSHINAVVLA